jgi:ubiquinone/menaquinone biosynthesis C-methylase UbiE
MRVKQVDQSHYDFGRYMSKQRWMSVWHQVDEMLKVRPTSILEVGHGSGAFKAIAAQFGLPVQTVDLDPDLRPDYVADAEDLPFEDSSFDVVCAFQMLEHLPYEAALSAFSEMIRVSAKNVVISLPDAKRIYRFAIQIPKLGELSFFYPRPRIGLQRHQFDGEHYWEINKSGYSLTRVLSDLSRRANLVKTFRVRENTYHRFFVFAKN